jgi:hypothetical protein
MGGDLMTDRILTPAAVQALKDQQAKLIDDVVAGLAPVTTPGPEPEVPEPPAATWSSGAFTEHDPAALKAMGTWRGRPMDNAAVFPTYDQGPAGLENAWWLKAAGDVPDISIGIPMCVKGGNISTDLSPQFRKMAATMKADGRRFFLRLGWEMNINQPWKVTDANLLTWRMMWSRYYDLFKGVLGDKGLVGFNPNIGENQSGLSGSILRAWVEGKVDWCGPDAYDCWPAFTNGKNLATQLTRNQGLEWWAMTARTKKVWLGLPEFGNSSGTQWAGNCGMDNPAYISAIAAWRETNRNNWLFDSYFNERASYVASDIFRVSGTPTNPKAGQRYRELFGA